MTEKPTIFLSSTWADLEEHRKMLLFTFARLKKWVEAMEYFGARPGDPLDESLRAVRNADIYIGVIGTRYGSKDKNGISITQREYEAAYRYDKTILVYLIDEEKHPLLPKFVDTGEDAASLLKFKDILRSRHTCATFSSSQDLAMQIGVDLIHHLELHKDEQAEAHKREFYEEMPRLLSDAGYSLGLQKNVIDLSNILGVAEDGRITIQHDEIRKIIIAGYLALNVSKSNYDVLKMILTFDRDFWLLFVHITRHYGVDCKSMADFIDSCRDPMHFRILAKLAGELQVGACAAPLCRRLLGGLSLDAEFASFRQQATPLRTVVREALESMPTEILPVVEDHLERSRKLSRWQQKKVFEAAAKVLRRRLEKENAAATGSR